MTIEDDISLLSRVPTFSGLRADALRIMAIGAESKAIPGDEVLFTAGETADCGFVIESGSFKLVSSDQSQPLIATRGALLGELALIAETHRPVTAVAREPSMVMRIARPLFLRMLEGYPDVAEQLRQEFTARADQLEQALRKIRFAFDTDKTTAADRVPDRSAADPAAIPDDDALPAGPKPPL